MSEDEKGSENFSALIICGSGGGKIAPLLGQLMFDSEARTDMESKDRGLNRFAVVNVNRMGEQEFYWFSDRSASWKLKIANVKNERRERAKPESNRGNAIWQRLLPAFVYVPYGGRQSSDISLPSGNKIGIKLSSHSSCTFHFNFSNSFRSLFE